MCGSNRPFAIGVKRLVRPLEGRFMNDNLGYPVLPVERRQQSVNIPVRYTQTSIDGRVHWELNQERGVFVR